MLEQLPLQAWNPEKMQQPRQQSQLHHRHPSQLVVVVVLLLSRLGVSLQMTGRVVLQHRCRPWRPAPVQSMKRLQGEQRSNQGRPSCACWALLLTYRLQGRGQGRVEVKREAAAATAV